MVRYCLLRNRLVLLNGSCLSLCSFSRKKQNRAGGPSSTSRVTQSGNTLFLKPTFASLASTIRKKVPN